MVDLAPARTKIHSPAPIPLSVLFEDDDLIVLDKVGMAVLRRRTGDIPSFCLHHCRFCPVGAIVRVSFIVGQGDSGVMVVAKTEKPITPWSLNFLKERPEKFTMLLSRVTRNRAKERFLSPLGVIQRSA